MLLAGNLTVKPTPLALFRNKQWHALTAPLSVRDSSLGSSRD